MTLGLSSRPTRRRGQDAGEVFVRSLFEEHGRAILAYATRLTGDRGSAEDVVQEALLRAWRHSGELEQGKGSVRGWLLTVVRNIVVDRARARNARPAEVAATDEATGVVPHERDHADRVVDTVVVLDALDQLSEEHREVLEHVYMQGRSAAETAEVLGIPPGTVKSRSFYALRALRKVLPAPAAMGQGAA